MKTLKNIPTTDLHAYLNIIDNMNGSNQQLANSVGEMHAKNPEDYTSKDAEEILVICRKAFADHSEISVAIQKELDSRMKKDLGIVFGIRKTQSIFQKFDDQIATKERKDNDKAAERIHQLKVAKDDTTNKA